MNRLDHLAKTIQHALGNLLATINIANQEIVLEIKVDFLKASLLQLRDAPLLAFNQLIDLCGVDYLRYGSYDWETESTTLHGFSRGVEPQAKITTTYTPSSRFAVVYHLLSTKHNHRVRVKVFLQEPHLIVPSCHEIWKGANWFEREAYDFFGILFDGHPDLRRILTDYGFIGHPFRKDFPLSGQVEMRYDASLQKVIYEPVDIEPRVSVPKVIRQDNRYLNSDEAENSNG